MRFIFPAKVIVPTIALTLSMASAAHASAGAPIVVYKSGDVYATYTGASAAYQDNLGLLLGKSSIFNNKLTPIGQIVNLGTFTAGTVLTFDLRVKNAGQTYFSGAAELNPDDLVHALATNGAKHTASVGFEDLYGGGDRDYNDLTFSVSNAVAVTPEPATWALMIMGMGMVGAVMRRRSIGALTA